ncbi:MAG: helix-turn-helix domain-containing protein [Bacteroidota bacterium]
MLDFLHLIGLTPPEAKLYQSLWSFKKASASQLACQINQSRHFTRHHLQKLLQKGFASCRTKGNTNYYEPKPPVEVIARLQAEKSHEQEVLKQNSEALLLSIYPEISRLQPQFHSNVKEALKAYETFFELIPDEAELLNLVHAVDDQEYEARQQIIDFCVKKRMEKKIKIRCLATFQPNTIRLQLKDSSANRETRIFNADYPFPFELMVHPNAFLVMTRIKGQILSLLLQQSPFTHLMNEVFTELWNQSTPHVSKPVQRENKGC